MDNNNGVDFDEDVPVSSKSTTVYQGNSRDTASMPGLLDEIYRLNL